MYLPRRGVLKREARDLGGPFCIYKCICLKVGAIQVDMLLSGTASFHSYVSWQVIVDMTPNLSKMHILFYYLVNYPVYRKEETKPKV